MQGRKHGVIDGCDVVAKMTRSRPLLVVLEIRAPLARAASSAAQENTTVTKMGFGVLPRRHIVTAGAESAVVLVRRVPLQRLLPPARNPDRPSSSVSPRSTNVTPGEYGAWERKNGVGNGSVAAAKVTWTHRF